jgi:hypothetical protein
MSAAPTPQEVEKALAASRRARAAALALASQKSPEWLSARAKKAADAGVKARALRKAIETARRADAGEPAVTKRKRYDRALPAEELLRVYYPTVDQEFPGLQHDQRRQKAAQLLRAERARLEAQ